MLFVLMTMLLDGGAPPAGLISISASANGTSMLVKGMYERGDTTPMLVWPRKDTWHNPCRAATDLCCVRDLLLEYRNDELQRQQGPRCLTSLKGDFVTGSRPDVLVYGSNFTAMVPLDTPFLAMLFVHVNPFYTLDSVQTFSLRSDGSVDVRAVVQNNPCYSVEVPGRPFKVCMHCNNILRSNAHFVWTPTWYIDYVCDWRCDDGFELSSLGNQCATATAVTVPLQTMAYGICAFVVVVLGIGMMLQKQPAPDPEPDTAPTPQHLKAEIIQFRETSITPMHIRVKMN
jgi:hypothetical protein